LNSKGVLTGVSAAGRDDVVGGRGGAGVLGGVPRPDEGLHAPGRGLLEGAQHMGIGGGDGGFPWADQGGGGHYETLLTRWRGLGCGAVGGAATGAALGHEAGGGAPAGGLQLLGVGVPRGCGGGRAEAGGALSQRGVSGGREGWGGLGGCAAVAAYHACTASIISWVGYLVCTLECLWEKHMNTSRNDRLSDNCFDGLTFLIVATGFT